ncbi:GNAT family N-acetyltransferase [Phytohabitans kaempferiae]|uniref:GNAT family N-acetyltransferase n=1 Tax=Phytohabitans kaempferiae TaxID=1620943 RepID=A0ABV6M6U5_9ACTN
MRIETHEVLPEVMLDEAWRLYSAAFDDLRIMAVQRHLMSREDFDAQMSDPRVRKYLVYEQGHGTPLTAVGTLTNDLAAAPLISPDFFRHRWPAFYARRQVWYVGFYAVHPEHRGSGVFARLIEEMVKIIAPGVAVVDFCAYNEDVAQLPRFVLGVLEDIGEVRPQRLDAQAYWSYEFPAAS